MYSPLFLSLSIYLSIYLSVSLKLTHTSTYTHTHAHTHTHTYVYIYIFLSLEMVPGANLLNTQHLKVRVEWSNPCKGVEPSPTFWCSSYRKGSLRVTLDYGHQLISNLLAHIYMVLTTTIYIYIYIYIYTCACKSMKQYPTKCNIRLPLISHKVLIRRPRHTGHLQRNKDQLTNEFRLWTLIHGDTCEN